LLATGVLPVVNGWPAGFSGVMMTAQADGPRQDG